MLLKGFILQAPDARIIQGSLSEGGRFSTFDLLAKIGCFVKKKTTDSIRKAADVN
jgi:hypothetical protein